MVFGDLGRVFVCVLCRVWFADAIERAHVCVPPASAAGIRNAQLEGFSRRADKEFPVCCIRGARLCAHLQFSATPMGRATTMIKKLKMNTFKESR